MSTNPKIYTAKEVASAGFSKEHIEKSVAHVTQIAYKEAKSGGSSITYGAYLYFLNQVAHRLMELGYTVNLTQTTSDSGYIIVQWDGTHPVEEDKK